MKELNLWTWTLDFCAKDLVSACEGVWEFHHKYLEPQLKASVVSALR